MNSWTPVLMILINSALLFAFGRISNMTLMLTNKVNFDLLMIVCLIIILIHQTYWMIKSWS